MSLAELLDGLELVDHHCHSVTPANLDRAGIEGYLTEAHETAPGISSFDTPLGASVRRWCAPVLDLEPYVEPEEYVARRFDLGADQVNRRFLRAGGTTDLFVDAGYREVELLDAAGLARASGARIHDVLRLESLAEDVARECRAADFADAFTSALGQRARGAVALKSVVAYRFGFDLPPEAPTASEVGEAAHRWLEHASRTGRWRLTAPVLLRFVLWVAAKLGHCLQLHAGLGDPDLRLHRADPSLLSDFLEAIAPTGTRVMLLHCWPYHRQAAYLAAVYPHVFFDVGLALNHVGARASGVVAEAMEVAPYQKLLYSSDAFGLAELHYLGSLRFRRALAQVLGEWVAAGEMSSEYAAWVAQAIGSENARRVYGLAER